MWRGWVMLAGEPTHAGDRAMRITTLSGPEGWRPPAARRRSANPGRVGDAHRVQAIDDIELATGERPTFAPYDRAAATGGGGAGTGITGTTGGSE
jgi:hypothetical protein